MMGDVLSRSFVEEVDHCTVRILWSLLCRFTPAGREGRDKQPLIVTIHDVASQYVIMKRTERESFLTEILFRDITLTMSVVAADAGLLWHLLEKDPVDLDTGGDDPPLHQAAVIGNELLVRCLLQHKANMWLKVTALKWDYFSVAVDIRRVPSPLFGTAVYYSLLRDGVNVLKMFVEFGCMRQTTPSDLVDMCLHLDAAECLTHCLQEFPLDPDRIQHSLHLACSLGSPILLKHGAVLDDSVLLRYNRLLHDTLENQGISAHRFTAPCAPVLKLILQNVSKAALHDVISDQFSIVKSLLGRLKRRKTLNFETDIKRYYADLSRCVDILTEEHVVRPADCGWCFAEAAKAVAEYSTSSHCSRTEACQHHFSFLLRLIHRGFPVICPNSDHDDRNSFCLLWKLVNYYVEVCSTDEMLNSANNPFFKVLNIILDSGCDPNDSDIMADFLDHTVCPDNIIVVSYAKHLCSTINRCFSVLMEHGLDVGRVKGGTNVLEKCLNACIASGRNYERFYYVLNATLIAPVAYHTIFDAVDDHKYIPTFYQWVHHMIIDYPTTERCKMSPGNVASISDFMLELLRLLPIELRQMVGKEIVDYRPDYRQGSLQTSEGSRIVEEYDRQASYLINHPPSLKHSCGLIIRWQLLRYDLSVKRKDGCRVSGNSIRITSAIETCTSLSDMKLSTIPNISSYLPQLPIPALLHDDIYCAPRLNYC